MNKLISELHSQCKVNDEGKLLYFDYERFAELIVRECAEFANEHNSEVEGVTLGIGKAIKENFGVKE